MPHKAYQTFTIEAIGEDQLLVRKNTKSALMTQVKFALYVVAIFVVITWLSGTHAWIYNGIIMLVIIGLTVLWDIPITVKKHVLLLDKTRDLILVNDKLKMPLSVVSYVLVLEEPSDDEGPDTFSIYVVSLHFKRKAVIYKEGDQDDMNLLARELSAFMKVPVRTETA